MTLGPLKAFYFLHYAAVASFLSFFPAYLRGLGFTGEQIGAAFVPAQIVFVPAALVWGALADKLGAPSRALMICTGGATVAMAALPFISTPAGAGVLFGVHALFNAGTVPLVDTLTIEAVQRDGSATYSRTRLFGSIGFIIAAQGLGIALAARGNLPADVAVPLAAAGCVAGTAAMAALIHRRRPQVIHPSPALPRARLRDALELLRGPLPVLLAFCAVHWAACAPYHLLFGVLIRDRGFGAELTGLGMALGVVAEVAALFAFPRIAARVSLRGLLAITFAATALRWLLVWQAASQAGLVAPQLLHGATFGLWWGAAVQAMGTFVPARLRATGQAIFSAAVFGMGNAIGFAFAGAGYDRFGAAGMFAIAGVLEVVNAAAVLVLGGALAVRGARRGDEAAAEG